MVSKYGTLDFVLSTAMVPLCCWVLYFFFHCFIHSDCVVCVRCCGGVQFNLDDFEDIASEMAGPDPSLIST